MHPQKLMENWTKANSLIFLKEEGFNTPDFRIITCKGELRGLLYGDFKEEENISVRTFLPGKDSTTSFKEPFKPNLSKGDTEEFYHHCSELLKTHTLILSKGINPQKAVARGNIRYLHSENWALEFMKGPGTVRDLEAASKDDLFQIGSTLGMRPLSKVMDCLGTKGLSIVKAIDSFYWGIPLIVEWSIYEEGVGRNNSSLIFWEIRKS